METTTTELFKPRRPRTAFWLSFLAPGLGHIYCGKFSKGFVLFCISTVVGVCGSIAIFPIEIRFRSILFLLLLISAAIWIYTIIDAPRTAKRMSPDYVLKDYNRWVVYLLLVLLEIPMGIGTALYARGGIVEAFYLTSKSMYPTIYFGDKVLANKAVYRSQPVRRGDVIAFINPNKRYQKHVKRVVALPGDTLEIQNNKLLINGKTLETAEVGPSNAVDDKQLAGEIFEETNHTVTYQILVTSLPGKKSISDESRKGNNFARTTVPNGHCFVLGDNRNNSNDSRYYGPVHMSDIIGRVDYIYYPRWVNLKNQGND